MTVPHIVESALLPFGSSNPLGGVRSRACYTLAYSGRPRQHSIQLPHLFQGRGPHSSTSSRVSTRVMTISSSGPFLHDASLEDVLVIRGRGLSRTPLGDHPPPELHDGNIVAPFFLQSIREPLSSSSTTPTSSGRSSPSTEDNSLLSTSQGSQGYTTERSSIDSSYTWAEFYRQAARTVTQHLDVIEGVLFEGNNESTPDVHQECQEWSSQFPHLRILGRQILAPQETGWTSIPMEGIGSDLQDVTDNDTSISADSQGLSLTGRHVSACKAPVEAAALISDQGHSEYAFLVEDIYVEDGVYEEIIAIDYKDIHEDLDNKKQITPRRRRIGYPPITPNACLKDSVTSAVFDFMWQEIISWMRTVIKEFSILLESKLHGATPLGYPLHDPTPSSREPSYALQHRHQLYPLQRAHTHLGGSTDNQKSFEDLLHISPIALKDRHVPMDPSESQALTTARPGTSLQMRRPMSVRPTQKPKGRLAPLAIDRSKTPNGEDERNTQIANDALLVKKIMPNSMNRPGSPPPSSAFHRNGALPPLEMLDPSTRKYRASSAIDNKDIRANNFRERASLAIDPRPSTTFEVRSDMQFVGIGRRSSTPLGQYSQNTRNQFLGNKTLGITGSRVTGSQPPDIVEDHEGPMEGQVHPHWTSNPSGMKSYRRGRTSSSLVPT
ncbi:primary cilium assembly protein FAM149B1-like isoform X2 [Gigantopelta aegis]|uniref:primary cilium assembly protein FAM149B1-like isoform X2 n=1 Tax=Gigantopelta aegis TaxID=1735272 RepID=UPI001B88DC63|nr:primary cilium assembly protein FAM149B1-like isoform X2 [Gigantopelta aegis]